MPRVYRGAFAEAQLTHPVTGALVLVTRDVPTDELDDVPDDVDLGPEWETVPAPAPTPKPKPAPTPKPAEPQEGDTP